MNVLYHFRFALRHRYGSYLAYNYDQDHTNALGCQYEGNNCDVMEDKITVLNIVMALLGPVSLNTSNLVSKCYQDLFQILDAGEIPESITGLLGLDGPLVLPESVVTDTIELVSGVQKCCPVVGGNCNIDCKDDLFITVCAILSQCINLHQFQEGAISLKN